MTPSPRPYRARRALPRSLGSLLRVRELVAVGAAAVVLSVCAGAVLAVPQDTATDATPQTKAELKTFVDANAQTLAVPQTAVATPVAREDFSSTGGYASIAAGGTNHDWAKLVLISGGWEMSENNVTVILRWMRQENGTADWWNRNNPLNSGYGSGGGGGLGTYDNLVIAGQKVAELLHRNAGYASIVAALAESASTDVTERAIWASPWATGHYDNGGHWSSAEVPAVKAPESAWQ